MVEEEAAEQGERESVLSVYKLILQRQVSGGRQIDCKYAN